MNFRKCTVFQTIALVLIFSFMFLNVQRYITELLSKKEIQKVYTKNAKRNTTNDLGVNEILEFYTRDSSITEIESRVQKERNEIEKQLSGMVKKRMADIILVGMFKAGTTTMSLWLTTHPQIIQLRIAGYYGPNKNYALGHVAHVAQIPNVSKDKIIYERCTVCFTSQAARERILAAYPQRDVKLLIMVRDPIERLISGYVQNVYQNYKVEIKESFEEYIFYPNGTIRTDTEYFQKSFYVRHLAKWLLLFPRGNIHLVDADTFTKKPWVELEKIEQLLKINHLFSEDRFPANPENPLFRCLAKEYTKGMYCMGHAKGRTHPDVSTETMQKLKRYFKPYNEQFFTLAGQRFSWSSNYN
ncbi:unnamed protein product [Owenia fusiformis]|uniref:Sulfotransferase domain-containing protein n=1 Tax=Owenia fusiformis TaxID=6347 RepID=A0A8S4N373_OWEFU|nr:unnamed protein product [Owenia fusiformis]